MTIAGIYCRASRQDQTTEQQEEKIKEYCNNNGIEIYKIYSEVGQSGIKESRPQLDLMLQDMRAKKFNCVIVLKYDRLGRSTIHLLQVLEEMKNLGIRLIATEQNIDTSTPMGKWFVTNLISMAEMEREMIVERTKAKLDYYKEQIKKKGYFINKKGKKCFSLGRPKGSKDLKYRKKGGYYLRYNK
jgi:DNA invertase Pin-like site-specific DNA recombinase|tara:strand:+ start:193 stop:750 length:558 start_codon:yes stop_codon:yes gene_type:complete